MHIHTFGKSIEQTEYNILIDDINNMQMDALLRQYEYQICLKTTAYHVSLFRFYSILYANTPFPHEHTQILSTTLSRVLHK